MLQTLSIKKLKCGSPGESWSHRGGAGAAGTRWGQEAKKPQTRISFVPDNCSCGNCVWSREGHRGESLLV